MGACLLALSLVPASTSLATSGELEKDDSTLALWKMKYEAGTKTIVDLTGHYILQPINKLKTPPQVVGQNRGMAMAFSSGVMGFMIRSNTVSEFIPENGITVEAWIRPQASERPINMIVECMKYLENGWRFAIFHKHLTFIVETAARELCVEAPSSGLFDGQWHLVAAEYNPETGRAVIKMDGNIIREQVLQEAAWNQATGLSFHVGYGAAVEPGWYFEGDIDSIRISKGASK